MSNDTNISIKVCLHFFPLTYLLYKQNMMIPMVDSILRSDEEKEHSMTSLAVRRWRSFGVMPDC